jgi:hypothetical protein
MISDPSVRQALGNDRAAWLFVPWPRDSRVLQRAFTMPVFRTADVLQSDRFSQGLNRLGGEPKERSLKAPRDSRLLTSRGGGRSKPAENRGSNRGVATRTKNPCAGDPLNCEGAFKGIKRDASAPRGQGGTLKIYRHSGLLPHRSHSGIFFQAASFGDGALVQRRRSFNHFKPANEVRVESERRSCICFRRALPGGVPQGLFGFASRTGGQLQRSLRQFPRTFFWPRISLNVSRGGQHQQQRSVHRRQAVGKLSRNSGRGGVGHDGPHAE